MGIRVLYIALARPKMCIQLKVHAYVAQRFKEHEIKLVTIFGLRTFCIVVVQDM